MTRLTFFAFATALLIFPTAISHAQDTNNSATTKTTTTGQVVIEINGVPQIIELDSSPTVLKKQLKNISENLVKKGAQTNDSSKKRTSKSQSSSGNFSYHTIIVGPDGAVKEEKGEKNIDGGALNHKQILKELPEEIRKQFEDAMEQARQKGALDMPIGVDKKPTKIDIIPLLKNAGADLPADVRKQLMKAMQGINASGMNVGNVQARAIIIGPDGKTQEYNFGGDINSEPNTKKLKAAGEENGTTNTDKKVLDTLSKILERLEKIESELKMLKKANE